ncbi:helix-turn-helix transcriptional regulator [Burkholderia gladioli]|uniref:helix-turn-helix transcriptional regulator n=1 Tax=Burkholderia gladioli TaxID=28095 RepID=UPI0016410836|nr:LuxR C-terminal-related transcriptional regulator [Burkholderia gladioli]
MEFSRLFSHVGDVILSGGSRRFPRMMHRLINAALPISALKLVELCTQHRLDADLSTRTLGATLAGEPERSPSSDIQPSPHTSDLYVDDTLAGPGETHELIDRFIQGQSTGESHHRARFHLATLRRNRYYLISLYRDSPFLIQDRQLLSEFAHVLFPIVASHAAALDGDAPSACAAPERPGKDISSGRERMALRFSERIRQAGVKLSIREMEACTALLAGDTVPDIAAYFALSESTVDTYLKRASIKLGFAGRHGLTRWMLEDGSHEPATVNPYAMNGK